MVALNGRVVASLQFLSQSAVKMQITTNWLLLQKFTNLIIIKQMSNGDELFPLVNEDGIVIGKATRSFCHSGSKPLHPVVHLHILNSKGELYLQKRSMEKDIQPGKWDTAVGGHIDFGEEVEEALKREAREELGIREFEYYLVTKYLFESEIERELINCFKTTYNGIITPDLDEVDEGRFWSMKDILSNIGKGVFTPNFESEFLKIKELL